MANKTKLDELYSLRENFTIIGLTGRTGSGCSDSADILSKPFVEFDDLPIPNKRPESIQERKYEIVYNFNKANWKIYKKIEYKNILLLLIINSLNKSDFDNYLKKYFRKSKKDDINNTKIELLHNDLKLLFEQFSEVIIKIKKIVNIEENKDTNQLRNLGEIFWSSEFRDFADKVNQTLKKYGVIERIYLLHHTAANYRKHGQYFNEEKETDYKNIYFIAKVINRIIKATKLKYDGECHIVIDSLRNSSEINFFKERYSGFYLIAVKSENRKSTLLNEYNNNHEIVDEILSFDEIEYKCNDFIKGHFFAPDVQNCIQKADYHIIDNKNLTGVRDFISLEQQLLKLQALIQQPGLITPGTEERCMQLAFNAKLSSGCISRQVGAVITDQEFSVKAIGWNDVPRGTLPCALRNVKELKEENPFGFSEFEKGNGLIDIGKGASSSGSIDPSEVDKESKDFKEFVLKNYNESTLKESDLGGINCAYCFKTAYNKFKGDSNQVHTRSLHAEENAMLQIAKYGGQALKNGILFTTASPCELCSKKAYQLGITKIFYIDPYPGISKSHILKQGLSVGSREENSDPELCMFSGAIGRGYIKLYEPFMAQKDEITILTDLKVETPDNVQTKQLKEFIKARVKDNKELALKLDRLYEAGELNMNKLFKLIEDGLNNLEG
jgi:deoxycytidylate deaminase